MAGLIPDQSRDGYNVWGSRIMEGAGGASFSRLAARTKPLRNRDAEHAPEEAEQFGAEARVEPADAARTDAQQTDRHAAADRDPHQSLRADKPGGASEQRRIARQIGLQQRIPVGAQ